MSGPGPRPRLLDERGLPALRDVIGDLLVRSDRVDLALTRVRLGVLDLTQREIEGPRLCRVLLGQVDATTLLDTTAPRASGPAIGRLRAWLDSGRLLVRSAGIGFWAPDFSVYHGANGSATSLVGAHYFGEPQLTVGPSFTTVLNDEATAACLADRFDALWDRGHDVAPAIAGILDSAASPPGPQRGRRGA